MVFYKQYRKVSGAGRFQYTMTPAILIDTRKQDTVFPDGSLGRTVTYYILRSIGKRGRPIGKPFEVSSIYYSRQG